MKTAERHFKSSGFLNRTQNTFRNQCVWAYCNIETLGQRFSQALLLTLGFVLLLSAFSEPSFAYDGSKYKDVCNNLVNLAGSSFGAMLTAIAGIGAIVASAMGGFKMAWGCVVVSVGSFIVGAYIELFFGKCGTGAQ